MARTVLPAGKNWVINPSAEVDTFGWVASVATLSRFANSGKVGTASFRMEITGTNTLNYLYLSRSFGGASAIPATPGDIIHTRGWIASDEALAIRLQLQFFRQDNTIIQTTYSDPVNAVGDWHEITHVGLEAPADTAFYSVMFRCEANGATYLAGTVNPAPGMSWTVDAVEVRINEPLDRYIDGDQGSRYHWLGTPHASASIRDEQVYTSQAPAVRGTTTIDAELWRYTLAGEPVENITHAALSGKVSMNSNADIKGVMSLKMRALGLVTPFVDVVAPFLVVTDAMGERQRYQMGLFAIPPGKESHTQLGSTVTLEGRDVTWYLANDFPTGIVNYAATANVVDTVKAICTAHGLNVNIPNSSQTFGKARTYHPDKSWLAIVNDMLNGIGYYTCWADRFGTVKSLPYFELAGAQPSLELYSGEGSPVINTIEQEGTYEGLANRVTVYKANTQGAPIIAVRTNQDATSPISTVATGRIINRLIADTNIADLATAKAMAKRYLEESASFTKKMKVITLPVPDRDLHEVYNLAIYNDANDVIAFGKWWCDQWECEIGFRPVSAIMTHHIKRLEPYGGDEV